METTATTVDMPTTSATAAAAIAGGKVGDNDGEGEDWVCFDNSMDDATSNANIAAVGIKPNIELAAANAVATSSTTTTITTDNTNTNSNSNNGKNNIYSKNKSNTYAEATTSSTAYSFTGSALGSGSIANLNAIATGAGRYDGKADLNIKTNNSSNNNTTTTTTTTTTNNNSNSSSSTTATSGTNGSGNSTNTNTREDENNRGDDSMYECNICLDTAKDAVVSMCGHLFCWPCLHQWLETRPNRKLCPVCKAAVDKDKVIPLYGRNSVNQEDPRNKVPPRPAGQRTEPEPPQGFPGFGFGDGFHMSFGIGAFPFGFFTSSLNFGEPRPPAANRGTTQYEDEQTLSKLFLYLAFMCIAWLLFA